jgi:Na+-driven multidrug efflux pump
MAGSKDILLGKLRSGQPLKVSEQFRLILLLSLPAILAQLSMCLMSYIDASMVGRLGSVQAAAVGLMSSSTWLFGSFCYGNSSGFTV